MWFRVYHKMCNYKIKSDKSRSDVRRHIIKTRTILNPSGYGQREKKYREEIQGTVVCIVHSADIVFSVHLEKRQHC